MFVLSSIHEGLGCVLIEALGCGTPCVSTNCESGPSEILDDGLYGFLVPVGDVDKMAWAIEKSLDEPLDSDLLKTRAKCFSLEKAAREYLSIA